MFERSDFKELVAEYPSFHLFSKDYPPCIAWSEAKMKRDVYDVRGIEFLPELARMSFEEFLEREIFSSRII